MNTTNKMVNASTPGLLARHLEQVAAVKETPGPIGWAMPGAISCARTLRQIGSRLQTLARDDGRLLTIELWMSRPGASMSSYTPGTEVERFLLNVGARNDNAGDGGTGIDIDDCVSEFAYHTSVDLAQELIRERQKLEGERLEIQSQAAAAEPLRAEIEQLRSALDSASAEQARMQVELREKNETNERLRAQVESLIEQPKKSVRKPAKAAA